MQLVDYWRSASKLWSVRLSTAAAIILSFVTTFPEQALNVWMVLPQPFRDTLPPNFIQWLALALIVLTPIARMIKQKEVPPTPERGTTPGILAALTLLALLACATPVHAQEDVPWNEIWINWAAVTTFDDGRTIPDGSVFYRVYGNQKGVTKELKAETATLSTKRLNVPVGEWCYYVVSVVGTTESVPTAEFCKVVAKPQPVSTTPSTPTGVVIR